MVRTINTCNNQTWDHFFSLVQGKVRCPTHVRLHSLFVPQNKLYVSSFGMYRNINIISRLGINILSHSYFIVTNLAVVQHAHRKSEALDFLDRNGSVNDPMKNFYSTSQRVVIWVKNHYLQVIYTFFKEKLFSRRSSNIIPFSHWVGAPSLKLLKPC